MKLENVFRRIHPNSANLFHGRFPLSEISNDLKQAMARRRTPRDKTALKSGLTSYMRSLQRCPAKVRTFFQAPTVRYAA